MADIGVLVCVLMIRGLLLGVYNEAPDVWRLPHDSGCMGHGGALGFTSRASDF